MSGPETAVAWDEPIDDQARRRRIPPPVWFCEVAGKRTSITFEK
jgi:hypothetical protein